MAAALVALAPVLVGCQPSAAPSPDAAAPSPAASSPTALPTFDAASTVGGYAPGFPVDLLAGPDDATVLASSAAPRDGLVDVSLNLATGLGTRKIVRQYAERLDAAGFEEAGGGDGSALAAQTVFTRTTTRKKATVVESVHVGVLDDGERRLVTVSGTVAPTEG
ncbi:hypothetical protein ATJ88_2176 [Isoptericola jiangsuensis]|uniref:LytR cell envelope-related transcriptional attenuator n=1 Tax=Isoptericola jiangsuensis TaxID=548579 RepID=A0A2A9EZA6_9MICO|nr:hypothetical protein ATJ88_2176 [Isoptericola jiangsuensis]